MYSAGYYDVVVIGAGHAGCEAALAAARLGLKTLVVTISLEGIAMMACNPSIGGPAKTNLVREVDALGGEMAVNTDKAMIQVRTLNTGKGPAVRALRAQCDKKRYQSEMKKTLERQENLDLKQDEVVKIFVNDGCVSGVLLKYGARYDTKAVIVATGTYLKGRIIIGDINYSGGPNGLFPANELSKCLEELGFKLRRFKTGTPARVDKRTVDFSKMIPQPGDAKVTPFSFLNDGLNIPQVPCWLTYTNEHTHNVIRENIHLSPLYSGAIKGVGPRYCPSIEDKVMKFPDKKSHQIFIEPEGLETYEMYVQGMSTSMPEEVQVNFLRTVSGLENVKIMRTAYAIEYDCIDSTKLKHTLESKEIGGLYFAGQINGTSGYEEAAAQGIIAGINAALKIKGLPPFILDRSDSYIGTLIDDLVTKGTNEPYRMLTSRSEYRLLLRQDNADLRLTERGYEIGLVSRERYEKFMGKKAHIEQEIQRLKSTRVSPSPRVCEYLDKVGSAPISSGITLYELLKRPEINYDSLAQIDEERPILTPAEAEEVEIQVKYEGYIKKQLQQVEQFKKLEGKRLPSDIDYSKIYGLSLEARQKLNDIKPVSIGQASRISGVSPADIAVLLVYLEKGRKKE
ncbi:tRNA uridine-5-carboxymethylaminomethyl(34) synthesis enzyme MnmG [Caldanaerobius polysaccharolyticus]|uniref:tRNA uridine-5-carboxymethylaminomethyl(34) synthesis enzyme MnmG n=1 Tax=Caldanaerobius polysaccharolyticus TaxID=44256 RepID=UPI00047AA2CB|nr:tRNA uridine-5-carboxymethylaminomethyl(34) synthesis enzyme MnmG [Caldanaerobius polysaccharolyticus]